jgi:hypothetical protein
MSKDYCPLCGHHTNHEVLFVEKKGSLPEEDFGWNQDYEVIRCRGCENIQFRTTYSDEGMVSYSHDEEGDYYNDVKYFPSFIMRHSRLEKLYGLPDKIRIVYLETLEALKSNCYLLTGVGLRAIIEAICIAENIAGRNLEQKINSLSRNKLITEKDSHRLHSIRFLGNDSVHEMSVPKQSQITIALNIIEHLLNNLYLIDIEANEQLDTIIINYEDFKNLYGRKLVKMTAGDEKSIKEALGKDFRRIESNYISNFTQELINEINAGTLSAITVGSVKNSSVENIPVQHFIKN